MVSKVAYTRICILITAGVLVLFAFFVEYEKEEVELEKTITSISIGANVFNVLLADTPALRTQGLSGRKSLGEDEGMLFIFSESSVQHFWMKEMNFPLDIIWISEDLIVAGIAENVLPESYPETVSSVVPVKYVLEINANEADKRGIIEGEKVEFIRQ